MDLHSAGHRRGVVCAPHAAAVEAGHDVDVIAEPYANLVGHHWRCRVASQRDPAKARTICPPTKVLERDVGVRFNGAEKTNVENIPSKRTGFALRPATVKDRYGNPLTIKLSGKAEPYLRKSRVVSRKRSLRGLRCRSCRLLSFYP